MTRVRRLKAIIKREFERASGKSVLDVSFTTDDRIIVATADGDIAVEFEMEIGSDDDRFVFINRHNADESVDFEFPPDWD